METSDKERIKKYANSRFSTPSRDNSILIVDKKAVMSFINGAEYERTIADQQLCLQEIELNHTKTLLASYEKALESDWNNHVAELKEQVDLQHEMARADQAKIAEKDKEIEHHAGIAYGMQQTIYKQLGEIASLKKALRKARFFVGNSETHTLSDEKTVSTFIDEIENLLK